MDTKGNFYLGRVYDSEKKQLGTDPTLYNPADLTTHAVVVGMTGSGKTGLCIGLLEEAALNNIPALLIDPKGDITNLLLHFPKLAPEDFRPWINPDEARRAGKSIDQAATDTATQWSKGLADWGIEPVRIQALQDSAKFAIYTPGSDAGIPISILASFKAPEIDWGENKEMLREKISGTVTALLTLVGMTDIDPVRSREHILLSNILEDSWSQGKDLDLGELILQVQEPPFEKLGVFDINRFFPEKDRFELAMLLNNILAAPSFQAWIEGQPLDIPSLLYAQDGKPRHSVFYIAHLTEQERMFFITLLYSAVESWMRSQPGTSSLRAIVYFDEIFGYLPPIKNPPSKQLLLRMLKQARAFGVAQVLVTQNPVDLDYKALSNAGSWFIGKLQTDQDKQRLLDGLQGALAGSLDRSAYDKIIAGLGKRVFLLHNVHSKGPVLFSTRWAMNYLAGPLTRTQLPELNKLVGAEEGNAPAPDSGGGATTSTQTKEVTNTSSTTASPAKSKPSSSTASHPVLPSGIAEYFANNNLSFMQSLKASGRSLPQGTLDYKTTYRAVLLAQASTRFINRKYNLDYELKRTALVADPDRRGMVRWDDYPYPVIPDNMIETKPIPDARFTDVVAPLTDLKAMTAMERDYLDWAYRNSEVSVWANDTLKLYAGPEISQPEFVKQCLAQARKARDEELLKLSATYDKKIQAIKEKITREQRELDQDKAEYNQRKMDEVGSGLNTVIGLFGGRRRSVSKNLTKRRMTSEAKADVDESVKSIAEYQKQITELETEKNRLAEEATQRWTETANQITKISMTPLKKDVMMELFGVIWLPYYVAQIGSEIIELPGFTIS